jgi:hypothetical protein
MSLRLLLLLYLIGSDLPLARALSREREGVVLVQYHDPCALMGYLDFFDRIMSRGDEEISSNWEIFNQ